MNVKELSIDKCTGCNACKDICPVKAIDYVMDKEGFLIPSIDENICTNCGACVKACPGFGWKTDKYSEPEVFKAKHIDYQIRLKSTSGGVFNSLATSILSEGGYVAGAVFNEDYRTVAHICSNEVADIYRMMGSKYYQGNAEGVYKRVKKILDDGFIVLFSGSPCQSVALQKFLGKEYENLYIVDYICRGINSPTAFCAHIDELEKKYNSKVKYVQFKNKRTGWKSLATLIQFENGEEYHSDRDHNPWIIGYIEGNLFMRSSCYDCQYRTIPRISDITFGDYWGVKNLTEEDRFAGVSLVMCNSAKGLRLLKKANKYLDLEPVELQSVIEGNPSLLSSADKTSGRTVFFDYLKEMPFSVAVEKALNEPFVHKLKRKLKSIIKRMLRLIKGSKAY